MDPPSNASCSTQVSKRGKGDNLLALIAYLHVCRASQSAEVCCDEECAAPVAKQTARHCTIAGTSACKDAQPGCQSPAQTCGLSCASLGWAAFCMHALCCVAVQLHLLALRLSPAVTLDSMQTLRALVVAGLQRNAQCTASIPSTSPCPGSAPDLPAFAAVTCFGSGASPPFDGPPPTPASSSLDRAAINEEGLGPVSAAARPMPAAPGARPCKFIDRMLAAGSSETCLQACNSSSDIACLKLWLWIATLADVALKHSYDHALGGIGPACKNGPACKVEAT